MVSACERRCSLGLLQVEDGVPGDQRRSRRAAVATVTLVCEDRVCPQQWPLPGAGGLHVGLVTVRCVGSFSAHVRLGLSTCAGAPESQMPPSPEGTWLGLSKGWSALWKQVLPALKAHSSGPGGVCEVFPHSLVIFPPPLF